jgi:hypothetical protein
MRSPCRFVIAQALDEISAKTAALPKRKGTKARRYPLPGTPKHLKLKGRRSATALSWPPRSNRTMPVAASPDKVLLGRTCRLLLIIDVPAGFC